MESFGFWSGHEKSYASPCCVRPAAPTGQGVLVLSHSGAFSRGLVVLRRHSSWGGIDVICVSVGWRTGTSGLPPSGLAGTASGRDAQAIEKEPR